MNDDGMDAPVSTLWGSTSQEGARGTVGLLALPMEERPT